MKHENHRLIREFKQQIDMIEEKLNLNSNLVKNVEIKDAETIRKRKSFYPDNTGVSPADQFYKASFVSSRGSSHA